MGAVLERGFCVSFVPIFWGLSPKEGDLSPSYVPLGHWTPGVCGAGGELATVSFSATKFPVLYFYGVLGALWDGGEGGFQAGFVGLSAFRHAESVIAACLVLRDSSVMPDREADFPAWEGRGLAVSTLPGEQPRLVQG